MIINYNEIDEKCIPMVKFFNSIGLTTKFSCQGHDNIKENEFQIMFEDTVTDDDIYEFLLECSAGRDHTPLVGSFYKWARKMGDSIHVNWMYVIPYGQHDMNQKYAYDDLWWMYNAKGSLDSLKDTISVIEESIWTMNGAL